RGSRRPRTRSTGAEPAVTCRSEASSAATRSRSVSMEKGCGAMRSELSADFLGRFRAVLRESLDRGGAPPLCPRHHPPRVSRGSANPPLGGDEFRLRLPIGSRSGIPSIKENCMHSLRQSRSAAGRDSTLIEVLVVLLIIGVHL